MDTIVPSATCHLGGLNPECFPSVSGTIAVASDGPQVFQIGYREAAKAGVVFDQLSIFSGGTHDFLRLLTVTVRTNKASAWDTRFSELVEFMTSHGHAEVPYADKRYPKLRRWIGVQRRLFRRQKTDPEALSMERILLLEGIGFKWERIKKTQIRRRKSSSTVDPFAGSPRIPSDDIARWDARFRELVAFKKRHGHFDLPIVDENHSELGRWVSNQRTKYRQRTATVTPLARERFQRLESIGFPWEKSPPAPKKQIRRHGPALKNRPLSYIGPHLRPAKTL